MITFAGCILKRNSKLYYSDIMEFLNLSLEFLESKNAIHTAKEICQQPEMWKKTYEKTLEEKSQLLHFLQKIRHANDPLVILSGAGTSAFIGETLTGPFQKNWGINCKSVSTTDIITHPDNCFIKTKPTLLISFARSGNSPESLQTCKLARKYCDDLYELNITCNAQGELAGQSNSERLFTLLLPEETNDISLAMTSSYSSMLLAGLLIGHIEEIERLDTIVSKVCQLGQHILDKYTDDLKKMAETDFERMVFLGSGPLAGVAHESHLKVQEMSNGKVICKYDSFLGFRHGPKAVVNAGTIIVYLFSNQSYPGLYERDLVRSVNKTAAGERSIAIGNGFDDKASRHDMPDRFQDEIHKQSEALRFDLSVRFPNEINELPEEFLPVFCILPAQIIAFFKSMHVGLSPDSPSENGAISRVVQGVNIY